MLFDLQYGYMEITSIESWNYHQLEMCSGYWTCWTARFSLAYLKHAKTFIYPTVRQNHPNNISVIRSSWKSRMAASQTMEFQLFAFTITWSAVASTPHHSSASQEIIIPHCHWPGKDHSSKCKCKAWCLPNMCRFCTTFNSEHSKLNHHNGGPSVNSQMLAR